MDDSEVHVDDYFDTQILSANDATYTSTPVHSTKQPKNTYTNTSVTATKKQKKESQEDALMQKAIACIEKVSDRKHDDDDVFGQFVASELRAISDLQCKNWIKWQIKSVFCNVQPQFAPLHMSTGGWNQYVPPCGTISTTMRSPSPNTGKD